MTAPQQLPLRWWMNMRRLVKHGAGGRFRRGWARDLRTVDAAESGDPEAWRRLADVVMEQLRSEWDMETLRNPHSPEDLVAEAFERMDCVDA